VLCCRSFIFIFQSSQIMLNGLLTAALFFRTTRHPNSLSEAQFYLGEQSPAGKSRFAALS